MVASLLVFLQGFWDHVHNDHYMWDYLYFAFYVDNILEKERTILEKDIHDKVSLFLNNSTGCLTFEIMSWQVFKYTPPCADFFPRNKAKVLPNDGIKTGDEEKEEKADKT